MLFPDHVLDELEKGLAGTAGLRLASVGVDVDPLEFVRAAHDSASSSVFFGRPGGFEIGAIGSVWEAAVASGDGRLRRLAAQVPDLPGARFLLGYSFEADGPTGAEWADYGPVRLVLPSAAVVREGGSTKLVVAVDGDPASGVVPLLRSLRPAGLRRRRHAAVRSIESVPAPGEWMDSVEEAVAAIGRGPLEKVVLARSVVVSSDVATDPFDLAVRLRSGYPGCFTYAWETGSGSFVGASPELLASVRGTGVFSEPLAGTTARGEGEDDDRTLGEQLMASSKNRHEHRIVIDDIVRRLDDLTDHLEIPSTPMLRRMTNIQHLSTRIRGVLHAGIGILDVVEALHPTPAIGGSPADEALAAIAKLELMDRGWYSGGIGWIGPDGDGDVAVALRCALLRGSTARLFAGAGIVAGSDAQSELEETRLKFGPMLSLLTEA